MYTERRIYRLWQKNETQWCHRPSVNTHTRTRIHPSTWANSAWAFNKHRPDYNDKERHTSGGGVARRGGRPCPSPPNECKRMRAQKNAPIWCVSARVCVCVRAYFCQVPSTSPPRSIQRKLISVLFCSPEDNTQAQCPASFSSAEREFLRNRNRRASHYKRFGRWSRRRFHLKV